MEPVSTISGQHGFQWRKLFVDITSYNKYRIVLEAVIGDGILGDIAIDDISFTENISCGSLTTNSQLTTTTANPSTTIYDCNFEAGWFCNWNLDAENDMNWKVQQGPSNIIFTGPSADHTLETALGYYIYIRTEAPVVYGDSARLISPVVNFNPSGVCLRFFYHMYGSNINKLNVYAKKNDDLGKPIWQKNGQQGNRWHLGKVFLENLIDFQFVLEGVAGDGVR